MRRASSATPEAMPAPGVQQTAGAVERQQRAAGPRAEVLRAFAERVRALLPAPPTEAVRRSRAPPRGGHELPEQPP